MIVFIALFSPACWIVRMPYGVRVTYTIGVSWLFEVIGKACGQAIKF